MDDLQLLVCPYFDIDMFTGIQSSISEIDLYLSSQDLESILCLIVRDDLIIVCHYYYLHNKQLHYNHIELFWCFDSTKHEVFMCVLDTSVCCQFGMAV